MSFLSNYLIIYSPIYQLYLTYFAFINYVIIKLTSLFMFLFLMHPYSFVIAGFLYIGWLSIILGVFTASHINLMTLTEPRINLSRAQGSLTPGDSDLPRTDSSLFWGTYSSLP